MLTRLNMDGHVSLRYPSNGQTRFGLVLPEKIRERVLLLLR